MQNEQRLAFVGFKNPLVKMRCLPGRKLLRFILWKGSLHREIGLGQIEGFVSSRGSAIQSVRQQYNLLDSRPSLVQVFSQKHRKAV